MAIYHRLTHFSLTFPPQTPGQNPDKLAEFVPETVDLAENDKELGDCRLIDYDSRGERTDIFILVDLLSKWVVHK
jgi:hypothetical protein